MGAYNDDEDLQRAFAAIKAQEEEEARLDQEALEQAIRLSALEEQEQKAKLHAEDVQLAASLVRLADHVAHVVQDVLHPQNEEIDEDLKRAMEASLKDAENQKKLQALQATYSSAASSDKSWDQNKQDAEMARGVANKAARFGAQAKNYKPESAQPKQKPIVRQGQQNRIEELPPSKVADRKQLFEKKEDNNKNKPK